MHHKLSETVRESLAALDEWQAETIRAEIEKINEKRPQQKPDELPGEAVLCRAGPAVVDSGGVFYRPDGDGLPRQ